MPHVLTGCGAVTAGHILLRLSWPHSGWQKMHFPVQHAVPAEVEDLHFWQDCLLQPSFHAIHNPYGNRKLVLNTARTEFGNCGIG